MLEVEKCTGCKKLIAISQTKQVKYQGEVKCLCKDCYQQAMAVAGKEDLPDDLTKAISDGRVKIKE